MRRLLEATALIPFLAHVLIVTAGAKPLTVTTLAGANGTGAVDGTGGDARFASPHGVGVDSSGNLYVTDTNNHTIRKITPASVVSTFAGLAGVRGSVDGAGCAARFNSPTGVAIDSRGNVYVADTSNQTIRKITPARVVTTEHDPQSSHLGPGAERAHRSRKDTAVGAVERSSDDTCRTIVSRGERVTGLQPIVTTEKQS